MLDMKLVNRNTEAELQLIGRLDTNTASEAERLLADLTGRFNSLTLDMSQLDYVSSAGLRVLKIAHMAMRRKGGALTVKNVSKPVMDVFDVTGFASLLKFA
ncbi:MAG: STAS domain-containing protein [Ruminococcaceae bacterium]|nr:STAS domain-containing protein [Oscillospiraceae bacterium]